VLVIAAQDADEVRARLAGDPWFDTVLTLESIEHPSIWVGSLGR